LRLRNFGQPRSANHPATGVSVLELISKTVSREREIGNQCFLKLSCGFGMNGAGASVIKEIILAMMNNGFYRCLERHFAKRMASDEMDIVLFSLHCMFL